MLNVRRIDLMMAGFYVGLGMSLGAVTFLGALEIVSLLYSI